MRNPNNTGSIGCQVSFGHGSNYSLYVGGGDADLPSGGLYPVTIPVASLATEAIWTLHSLYEDDISSAGFTLPEQNSTDPNLVYSGIISPMVAFAHISTRLIDDTVGLDFSGKVSISAAEECILSLCNMEYEISTEHGAGHSEMVNTDFGFIKGYTAPFADYAICWQSEDKSEPNNGHRGWAGHDNSMFCPKALATFCDLGGLCYVPSLPEPFLGTGTLTICADPQYCKR